MNIKGVIQLNNVVRYNDLGLGDKKLILENISLRADTNLITVVVAPRKAGLSTLMNLAAGFIEPTEGEYKRGAEQIHYIATEPSSFPWLNVNENMKLGKKGASDPDTRLQLQKVGLDDFEDHYAMESSYDFRFRLTLGRCLMDKPKVIVMDDPFRHVDDEGKFSLYKIIHNLKENDTTGFLIGTNNITEAVYLADKILLMSKNPATIFDEIEVNFNSERSVETLKEYNFTRIRDQILNTYRSRDDHKYYNFTI